VTSKYYESELTQMMRDLLQSKPHIAEEQRKGRALWWDKKADPDAVRRASESKIAMQAYVYQTKI
jgi:hypothetical protein